MRRSIPSLLVIGLMAALLASCGQSATLQQTVATPTASSHAHMSRIAWQGFLDADGTAGTIIDLSGNADQVTPQASRAVALDNNAATEDLALLGGSPHVSLPAKRQPYDQERQWRAEKQCANWQEIDFRRDCQDHHAGDGILSFGDDVLFANPTLSPGARRIKPPTTHDQNPVDQDDGYVPTPAQRWKGHAGLAST